MARPRGTKVLPPYNRTPEQQRAMDVAVACINLQEAMRRLQSAADSCTDLERASVLRRAAANIAVEIERIK